HTATTTTSTLSLPTPFRSNPMADPRKPGNNYLHIVILPWKDAEKAVAYLNKSGVPSFAVPDKKLGPIDPAEARAKNRNHLVFALDRKSTRLNSSHGSSSVA